jgi:hypothetical protein
LFSVHDVAEAKRIINMIFTHNSKSPFYRINRFDYEIIKFRIGKYDNNTWEPIEGAKELDEINLKTIVPAAAMTLASMLPSKDSAAQNQMSQQQQQQGIEKSISSARELTDDEKNYEFGKELIDSYAKNPFTAHMWSQKSTKNEKFYNLITKLVDYYRSGGQIEYSDYENLGEVAQKSPVAMDFMQR